MTTKSLYRTVPKRIESWCSLSPNVVFALQEVVGEKGPSDSPHRGIRIQGRSIWRSPPEYKNAIHEMAHMIDIDDRRVRMPGWGLRAGSWVSLRTRYSAGYWDVQTDFAIRRELRVMAIQACITEHFGLNFDYVEWASLLANGAIPNYCLWRSRFGFTYDDEHGFTHDDEHDDTNELDDDELTTTVRHDAEVLRSMRSELVVEDLWAEWVRKTKVVDRQIRKAKSRKAAVEKPTALAA